MGHQEKFSIFNSQFPIRKGFTLIEFLAVFSIMAVLSAVSIASFSSYNNTQVFQTSASEVVSLLNLAKSRSISQIKPVGCGAQPLQGYQVILIAPGPAYRLEAVCGSNVVVTTKNLGSGVTIVAGSTATVSFAAATGTSAPSTVTLTGYGKTTVIRTDSVGTISVQ